MVTKSEHAAVVRTSDVLEDLAVALGVMVVVNDYTRTGVVDTGVLPAAHAVALEELLAMCVKPEA